MKFEFGSQWLEVHKQMLEVFQQNIRESGRFDEFFKQVNKGEILFREGDTLTKVYILLEGQVQLYKKKEEKETEFPVDILQPGAFIGIIAYATGSKSLTTGRSITDIEVLEMSHEEFESCFNDVPEISDHLNKLLLANLVERYRHTVTLKLKLEALNDELKQERNDLKQAYYDLKVAQSRLVHQEKMATLGQLVAGFAHEINNPASALIRALSHIENQYEDLFDSIATYPVHLEDFKQSAQYGLNAKVKDTVSLRQRMNRLMDEYPRLDRSFARKLAYMPEKWVEQMMEKAGQNSDLLKYMMEFHEFGQKIKNTKSAGTRIINLVKSLKNYSKQDSSERDWIDVREGLQDTLQLVKNRLKYYELDLRIKEVPLIYGQAGELNQVWTNIILNACDAMGKKGKLEIACYSTTKNVVVKITDTGPGIDENMKEKIFEPNVTSKRHGTQFGLGLGLYISKDIVEQHGGDIHVENTDGKGAGFIVTLPITEQ